jgi:hypothetical protein
VGLGRLVFGGKLARPGVVGKAACTRFGARVE